MFIGKTRWIQLVVNSVLKWSWESPNTELSLDVIPKILKSTTKYSSFVVRTLRQGLHCYSLGQVFFIAQDPLSCLKNLIYFTVKAKMNYSYKSIAPQLCIFTALPAQKNIQSSTLSAGKKKNFFLQFLLDFMIIVRVGEGSLVICME